MASRMAATGSAVISVGRVGPVRRSVRRSGRGGGCVRWGRCVGDFPQQLLDSILVSDALVEHEGHFGRSAQPKSFAYLMPHEPGGAIERARCVLARRGIA